MASDVRIKLLLECSECKRRNYATNKNRPIFFEIEFFDSVFFKTSVIENSFERILQIPV